MYKVALSRNYLRMLNNLRNDYLRHNARATAGFAVTLEFTRQMARIHGKSQVERG